MGLRRGDEAIPCHLTGHRGGLASQLGGDLSARLAPVEYLLYLVALVTGKSDVASVLGRPSALLFHSCSFPKADSMGL